MCGWICPVCHRGHNTEADSAMCCRDVKTRPSTCTAVDSPKVGVVRPLREKIRITLKAAFTSNGQDPDGLIEVAVNELIRIITETIKQ